MAGFKRGADDRAGAPSAPKYSLIGIYCDETGTSGLPYYGFGSLWIPWERRGDLAAIVSAVRARHYDQELKWQGVKNRALPMYKELVDEFFRRRWMVFHSLLVRRSDLNRALHRDVEEAMQKHYVTLLKNKIRRFARNRPDRRFRLRVDNLPFGYAKSDEKMAIILDRIGRQLFGRGIIADLRAVDSKQTAGVQVCDVLLGAVASYWQGKDVGPAKLELRRYIAGHLGWDDLDADTWPRERKFNIWHFHDPRSGEPRRSRARAVRLRYPQHWERG